MSEDLTTHGKAIGQWLGGLPGNVPLQWHMCVLLGTIQLTPFYTEFQKDLYATSGVLPLYVQYSNPMK